MAVIKMKVYEAFGLGLLVSILIGFLLFTFKDGAQTAQAEKYILYDNDIYLASDILGSKRVTTDSSVQLLFGEQGSNILIGKNPKGAYPDSEQTSSVELYLYKVSSGEEKKITDERIDWATFDKEGRPRVIYVTNEATINLYDYEADKLTQAIQKAINPDISKDGTKIVYKKLSESWMPGLYYDGSQGLVITDLSTGQERKLTSTDEDYAPFWSPDGKYVIFYSNNPGGLNSLFMINEDGSKRTLLTNIGETYVSDKTVDSPSEPPIWSDDGKYLVYESDRRIWINELDLKNRKLISAKAIAYGVSPQWVENGKTISVVTTKASDKSSALTVMDLEGNIIRKK